MASKGQPFKPTKTPRPPAAAKRLQRQYAAAPTVGVAQPARPAVPMQLPPLVAQPLPLDPAYAAATAQALAEVQRTGANVAYQRGQVRQEYGFDDVSNPYNRAAMLQRSFEHAQGQNLNTMAAQGQLYSGANQAVQDEGAFQQGRNYDALRREYEGLLQGFTQQEADAAAGYSSAVSAAELGRLQNALETRPYVTPTSTQGGVKGQLLVPTKTARPKKLAKKLQPKMAKAPKVAKAIRGL